MSLKQLLFNGTATLAEKIKDKVLQKLISDVEAEGESAGMQVTFIGEFQQKTKHEKSKVMVHPYLVIQNIDQFTDMPDGILSGVFYELGRIANITGSISPDEIKFDKRYDNSLISEREKRFYSNIRNGLFPEDKGKPLLNRSIIRYKGQSEDGGKTYRGTWEFNSTTADMATKGTFMMQAKIK